MRRPSFRDPSLVVTLIIIALLSALTACQGAIRSEPTPFLESVSSTEQEPVTSATQTPTRADETAVSQETSEPRETPTHRTAEPKATAEKTKKPTPPVRPSATPISSATPTPAPQFAPVLQIKEPEPLREGVSTPATAIPTAVPQFTSPSKTTNVILLGSDQPVGDDGVKRTDTMIIVSINHDGPSASMLSLPRDLYVYIPGGTMNRINTAVSLGGVSLLKQTILYNFGVPIHYFARVDFNGFEQIVDTLGGVEVAVGCHFKDWRIKSPELDPENEDNWYVHELEPGIHHMDGETALWYARSRLMSNDFDRGRRQQQLLRALLNQGVDLNLIQQAPVLWESFNNTVETDMDIGRMLQIASFAPAIHENGIQNLYLFGKTEPWIVPETNAQVQIPVWEGPGKMEETFRRLFLPPALNNASRAPITVEVINASGDDDMARLAAENLAWYGFVPVIGEESNSEEETTTLTYYGLNFKGSYDWMISWIFNLKKDDIVLNDKDTKYSYDYKVVLGQDFDPCLNAFFAPQAFLP